MITTYGVERAKAIYGEGFRAREDLKRFVEQENIDCDYQEVGRWTGANRPKHYDSQAREADFLNEHFDTGAYMVQQADQHSEIGSDLYYGGQIRPIFTVSIRANFITASWRARWKPASMSRTEPK